VRGGVIFSDDYRSYTNNFAPAAGWDTDFQWGTLRFPDVFQDYWGTLQVVRIRRGDCRIVGNGLPWGTSAIPPRNP
jgi:hypothetical protein